jgi:RimJ/RimL family protein N-acetyltransferase
MRSYKFLQQQIFQLEKYKIVPIRHKDRFKIMIWRNEQIYHLRQNKSLTKKDQENYFNTVVNELFNQKQPNQILFSYLDGDTCIGYGGLVHINWLDRNAEISFIMDTKLEKEYFQIHWHNFLFLLEQVAFRELNLHKIFVFVFDLRPHLYDVLKEFDYYNEARLKEHYLFDNEFIDALIFSKIVV